MPDTVPDAPLSVEVSDRQRRWMFATCFVALVATSFAFMIRLMLIDQWGAEFGLTATEKGQVLGAGIWPFAISIILFSLVIDRVGYGKAMAFAFFCHVSSVVVTVTATGYWGLFAGNFIAALAAGTVEAAINPAIATAYAHRGKTKWLNILHAGWPGGLVVAGLLTLTMNPGGPISAAMNDGEQAPWTWKVVLLLLPTAIYGLMLLRTRFPADQRVAAGVPYRAMLAEMGAGGALIAFGLIVWQLASILGPAVDASDGTWQSVAIGVTALIVIGYFAYVRTMGRPLFIFLLLVMLLLAITELGTDTWIKSLMDPVMRSTFEIDGGWVLIYTATIMMTLRLFAGPIVKALNPLGMLAVSSLFAAAGLAFLSAAQGVVILIAATVYGLGQTFFWPTTLGLIAERFPRGGALTLNAIAGVGMLGVGILGATLLGSIQDDHAADALRLNEPALHERVIGEEKVGVFGRYRAIDPARLDALAANELEAIQTVQDESKQAALLRVAILPLVMFVCYAGLWVYFRSRGGYREVALEPPATRSDP